MLSGPVTLPLEPPVESGIEATEEIFAVGDGAVPVPELGVKYPYAAVESPDEVLEKPSAPATEELLGLWVEPVVEALV